MVAGLILSWFRYEIECKATISTGRTGGTSGLDAISVATTDCFHTNDQSLDVLENFATVTASVEEMGSGAFERKWGVILGIDVRTFTDTGSGTPRSTLELENLKVYMKENPPGTGIPFWVVTWTAANWYRDGVFIEDFGAGTFNGFHFAPSGVPLLGVPAQLSGSASINPQPDLGFVSVDNSVQAEQAVGAAYSEVSNVVENTVHAIEDPFSDVVECPYSLTSFRHSNDDDNGTPGKLTVDATANGGWRFKPDSGSAYITPAVTVSPDLFIGVPGPCACAPVKPPTVGGSDTFALVVTSYAEIDLTSTDTSSELSDAGVHGFPNWTRSLRRMNPDYRALVRRYAMIGSKSRQISRCQHSDPGDEPPIVCQSSQNSNYPHDVLAPGGVTHGELAHFALPIANLVNFGGSPLWSFLLDYPIDGSDQWKVLGSAEDAGKYWLPIREQLMFQASLPEPEKFKTRNSVVTEPLMSGVYSEPFMLGGVAGQRTSWWGISRFDKMAYAIPGTFTYTAANSGLFTAVSNCSLAFGGDITVTLDGGQTSCVVRLDQASFSLDPFMLAQIAEAFATEWSDGSAAVVSVDVYLENPHGDKTLLTSVSSATAVRRKDEFDDSKYAGSWGQDLGAGTVADTGVDSEPEGESAAVMADTAAGRERVHSYQLLGGYGAKYLRFEIVVDTAGGTMSLKYPVMDMRSSAGDVVIENGAWATVVWADGPGVRFGQWDWTDGFVLNTVPTVALLGQAPFPAKGKKCSITDALAFKHLVLEGDVPNAAAIDADVAALYDTVEAPNQDFVDADDLDTHSVLVPDPRSLDTRDNAGIFLLITSRREVPPGLGLPVPVRNVQYDEDRDDWGGTSLSLIKSPRELLYRARSVVELVDPRDSSVWTTDVEILSGWHSARHDHPLNAPDNDEGATFEVTSGKVFATVSPWHGYVGVLEGPAIAKDPTNYTLPNGAYCRAHTLDGNIQFRYADWTVPEGGFNVATEVTATGDDTHPCIAHDPATLRIYLIWQREDPAGTFDCRQATSDDAGATWSSEVPLGDWKYPRVASNRAGTLLFMGFKHDSGSSGPGKLFHRVQLAGDTSPSAELAITDGVPADIDFEDDRFDIVDGKDSSGRWILTAKLEGETDVSEFHSFDEGATWEVI